MPDETMQDFLDAGLFRVLQPKGWGGFELNYGRAVDRLASPVGARGMLEDTPIQRAFRDVHGANNWDLKAVPYARELLGVATEQMRGGEHARAN